MNITTRRAFQGLAFSLLAALGGCGGGGGPGISPPPPPPPVTYTIGGAVSGLAGAGLVLQNNGGDDLAVAASGAFKFATALAAGAAFDVTVKIQPGTPAQTCVVTNAAGTVGGANVTNIAVTCTTNTYTVGGAVSGLTGSGLILQDNASDDLMVPANSTTFIFTGKIPSGASYAVTVKAQPSGPAQTCTVADGTGNVVNANIGSVVVTCTGTAPFVCGTTENGVVVTHAANISASETWAGAGTVHLIPNSIIILAPATVTVQPCAIVKLNASAGITVQGNSSGTGTAKLLAAGDDLVTGKVTFEAMDSTQPWGRLRGFNQNSLVELNNAVITGGGSVGGAQRNAVLAMAGAGTLPDPVLKVVNVSITNAAGPGIYLSDAAFTGDSDGLVIDSPADVIDLPAMALGSIPSNLVASNPGAEALVVENANIFDNLTVSTHLPVHFKTDAVHVGGLAPTFVPNVTLTLNGGVTLKFERASTAPTLVTFGDIGQSQDKNAALVVNGTSGAPVTFTSAVATPAPGDWAGLWLITSNGSQLDHFVIEYAGGDAGIGPASCGPIDPSTHSPYRHTAALLVGDGSDLQYAPPPGLLTNGTFRNNAGNFAIDSVWQAGVFGPPLNATNSFTATAKVCTQSKNYITGGCVVAGVDQSGCLVP